MRISRRLSDGTILEAQSNDSAPLDALVSNALSAGMAREAFEVLVVTDAEYFSALKAEADAAALATKSLTPRQARLALTRAGLRDKVEGIIANSSQDIKDTWQFASSIERSNPILKAAASVLGLTDPQLDALFADGATL